MSKGFEVKEIRQPEPRYQIEEEGTNGWFVIDNHTNLTKERCSEIYHALIAQGYNPQRLRISRVS